MPLTPGSRIGVFAITARIGAGGMGEVYQATDTNLDRQVAIKVLPEAVAGDAERLARFDREAKTLAALNHPNIAQIYGVEKADGQTALVMELVEGPTLGDRIAQGPIPVDEALPIAKQIAEALEAAHEQGIIHRDLKPANIKLRPDGTVKVLDFGLAKAMAPAAAASPSVSQSPTITTPAVTEAGVLLGTAAYMSPEQARSRPVDKRADIWAFGCVLYEMLTGQRAFRGSTTTEILAAVLEREPDWSVLPAGTDALVRRLLRRCLQKEPARRLRDIGDAHVELDEVAASSRPVEQPPAETRAAGLRPGWAVLAALGLAAVLAGVYAATRSGPSPAAQELRLEISTSATERLTSFAVAPDGLRIAFVAATAAGDGALWVRELGSATARVLEGTAGAVYPFWSPDGRSLGFFADNQLKRIDPDGGSPLSLADVAIAMGGTWGPTGTILFTPTQIEPIYGVSTAGGTVAQITQLEPGQLGHLFPQVLPGGTHMLYGATGAPDVSGVHVARVDGAEARRLLSDVVHAVYAPPGYLLFVRDTVLFAQPFDLEALALAGEPVPIADGVFEPVNVSGPPVAASASGLIVYRNQPAAGGRQLVWYDRSGTELSRVGEPQTGGQGPALSPDGRVMAVSQMVDGNRDIWLLDLARGVPTRFTFDPGADARPKWTPDGSRIIFSSNRTGVLGLYQRSVAGGEDEPIEVTQENTVPSDVSPDGTTLLCTRASQETLLDVCAVPLQGGGLSYPVVQTSGEDLSGWFSPDGAWIAYTSSESGTFQVSVRPFRGAGPAIQVSPDGGTQPRWRGDGLELYYLDLEGRLMATPMAPGPAGRSVDVGVPVPLFQTSIGGPGIGQNDYLPSPDGERFLLDAPVEAATPPLTVILNWRPPGEDGP